MENLILSPGLIAFGFFILGLAPFLAVMTTSFIKIAVVLQILRSALGLQQAPPNMAINGLAIVLTIYIMAPVGFEIQTIFEKNGVDLAKLDTPNVSKSIIESIVPIKAFLIKHTNKEERLFFSETTKKLWPEEQAKKVTDDHLLVLIPSFLMSQLKTAFEIGFLIYLPFLVIDLVISNILLAMGMMMVSPVTISVPFKILIFVLADGWTRLIQGLVLSYQ